MAFFNTSSASSRAVADGVVERWRLEFAVEDLEHEGDRVVDVAWGHGVRRDPGGYIAHVGVVLSENFTASADLSSVAYPM